MDVAADAPTATAAAATSPMRTRVDFGGIFWCLIYLMFLAAATVVRTPASTAVVSVPTPLIGLVLISVGIHMPTTAG